MTFLISVVVCTRNRAPQLQRSLQAIGRLRSRSDWELVLVDNASTDRTPRIAADFATTSPFPVQVVNAAKKGLAHARNCGLREARGRIVAFTDDDCYPACGYLHAIERCFAAAEVDYAGGRVLLHDADDRRVTIQESEHKERLEPGRYLRSGLIHGANMIFRAERIRALGGFDERLGAGTFFKAGEDTDMLRRMSASGAAGMYDPAIVVRHHHGRRTDAQERRLMSGYDRGVGASMIKFLLEPSTRFTYWRRMFWRARKERPSRSARRLAFGLLFWLRYGPGRAGLWQHPAAGLYEGAGKRGGAA